MALVVEEKEFTALLRILNTNVDGLRKVPYALTGIRGVGRRFATLCCHRANIDVNKRAGELTQDEIDNLLAILSEPAQYKIPEWFLNRQKDRKTNRYMQIVSNELNQKMREDFERMKKIRLHRGLRHIWGIKVRGQHTKTTGRRGRNLGIPGVVCK
mmetsp:Transcript_31229/g.58215  ORF Transcript_31229/g.58215 Transcript_31229/m.58215 type:complete len:156 (-) Transcript_31229:214-681(-)|eukprot:CAMPEP_0170167062 /NCGR_PEP_ID=MMETSP0040_2-20121228/572_1 /TAXON_ID=641309 /ORGANISM="Lotharella oceanica, Strain CCMP622" /LENGTH=155 /DNA_ID=CAMNT_0010404967 /DNA_START=27 /DNA_END=494 /DNA_ORIENTATION=+